MDDILEFTPPIAERPTDELIRIANYPDDWNPLAVEQAKQELLVRSVPIEYQQKKVKVWARFHERKRQVASQRKAMEGYDWSEIISGLPGFLISVLFDWNLKKNGYIRKYRQRKYILAVVAALVAFLYIWAKSLNN